jgi:hypothetical protein
VLVAAPEGLLDMALPAAAAAAPIVIAPVSWGYIAEADEPRLGWFHGLWEDSRLRLLRANGCVWVIICASANLLAVLTASQVYDLPFLPAFAF